MPAWNLSELMSRATEALGNRAEIPASTVSFWVNQSENDCWFSLRLDQQEVSTATSTTTNSDVMVLPTDFASFVGSPSNQSRSNALLTEINMDQLASFSSYSGAPTHFASYGTLVLLRPIPDSAYSLTYNYRRLRTEMTLTTAVPSVMTHLRPAIFHHAVQLLAENVTLDTDTAQRHGAYYSQTLRTMPDSFALRARDQHALGCSLSWRGRVTRGSGRSFDQRID